MGRWSWHATARRSEAGRVIAVLGPTNTGKTHYAVERMLAHESGVMGFPLRLLAREIFDRVVARKGASQVALVTGEERIGRADAPYVVATVEAMPQCRRFAFLAVDEIQLCADWERGHIFTDRLLRARGSQETIFLGSEIIRPLLRRLVPEAEIHTRPRLSRLAYVGSARLDRLPRKTAIVAFSAAEVYALAEVIRRRKGGAAVVLGALSPRTRNAQVGLYQSGEVDHLVATDAIGMGLNMDISHVAFAALHKFDGRRRRALATTELAQIAGRAGRYMADGSFGVTNRVPEPDATVIEALEQHRFAPLRAIRWRNHELVFDDLRSLARSLDRRPEQPGLVRVRDALDHRSLMLLAARPEIRARADRPERVRLLWEVCQIPDFRKTLAEAHLELLATVFGHLAGPSGMLPTDWVARMIARLDRVDGDIDALATRIAHIRTWTYLSHRGDWIRDAAHWQERARAVEDRLSDALHERLTQRFVDRRATALIRQLRESGELEADIGGDGAVRVEGHLVGRVHGLRFRAERGSPPDEERGLLRAAYRAVRRELEGRVRRIARSADPPFTLNGRDVLWQGEAIARLRKGRHPLRPEIVALHGTELSGNGLRALDACLRSWLETRIGEELRPLLDLEALARSPEMPGPCRGIAYQLAEGLGSLDRRRIEDLLRTLDPGGRRRLTRCGVRFGRLHLYVEPALRPAALAWRARLFGLWQEGELEAPPPGRTVLRDAALSAPSAAAAIGFVSFGEFAVRVDIAERLAAALRRRGREQGRFPLPLDLAAAAGLSRSELERVLQVLGFRRQRGGEETVYLPPSRKRGGRRRRDSAACASPFGRLRQLGVGT